MTHPETLDDSIALGIPMNDMASYQNSWTQGWTAKALKEPYKGLSKALITPY